MNTKTATTNKVSGKAFDMGLFKRIMSYMNPIKGTFYLASFLTVLLGIIAPIRPWLILYMVNEYIETGDKMGLLFWTLVFVGILIMEGILEFYQTYLANWLGQNITRDLRIELFNKITDFQLKYFDRTPIGRLVTRSISDIETINNIFSQGILTIISEILRLVIVVIIMFIINWEAALLVLTPVSILVWATR
ncbi:MAG: ABC transporter transmembrane domain-containing protein, partial [Flavobacteriales bacterium]